MLEFRDVTLADKEWARELLSYSDFIGCEYTFGNNFIWKDAYDNKIARYKDFYLIKSSGAFFFPAGRGNLTEVIDVLKDYCKGQGEQLYFSSVPSCAIKTLSELYENELEISADEDYFDYIYSAFDLATLSGKKYHSKRNYLNRLSKLNFEYEPITKKNIDECFLLNERWCKDNDVENDVSKMQEQDALKKALNNFFELDFKGGILRIDGQVEAFTIGEKLNSNTFNTHIEKANTLIDGTYAMINYKFANEIVKEFEFINREEDLGEENLRKAKQSYKPCFMEKKYQVKFI